MMSLVLVGCGSGASDNAPRSSLVTVGSPVASGAAVPTAGAPATPFANASGSAGAADMRAPIVGVAGSGVGPAQTSPQANTSVAPKPSGLPDVQFMMDINVPAGAEMLKCIYGAFPSDRGVIAVPSAESHYTPGSHHILAYRSDLTSIPDGQAGVFDCADGAGMMHNKGSYYEAQQPDARHDLPPGVAHKFQPSEVIILQSHYLNTTGKDIAAHVVLTLHTVDPSTIQYEAGTILFSNVRINIGPHSKARVTMVCPIASDINPALLWSHMHKRAMNFVATTDDTAAAAALGTLYSEPDWSEPQAREYPSSPPVTLHAGSHITFSCDYQNDSDATFTYGNSAEKNEMCILHGMYWPRMPSMNEGCFGGMATQTEL
jgi:hypothetical protein